MTCRIAVDIGGTKIAAGYVTDAQPRTVCARTVRPTEAHLGAGHVLSTVVAAIEDTIAQAHREGLNPAAIGIGAPGVVDPTTGTICYAGPTMPGWAGTPLSATVAANTGLPVHVANDVRVMGLGEAIHGAGARYDDVLFVSIGTGIGGAFIRDHQLADSPHHTRGEIAYAGCPTPEGAYSTLEKVGAGPALSAAYCRAAGLAEDALDLRKVMERYHAGEQLARDTIAARMECVGHGLANLVAAVDAAAIILGGGVGTLGQPILEPLTKGLRAHLLDHQAQLPLHVAQLGTDAPLVGAAELTRPR